MAAMKIYIYTLLFIAVAFNACTKASNNTYVSSTRSTVVTTTGTSSRTSTPTPVYAITFNNANQVVKVSLVNKTLTMNFYENINLLARKDSLATSWSIIFTEDFKATQLGKLNYTTVGKSGTVTTNYVESNLNNVAISSTKDTTVNNLVYTKISFNRNFIFTTTYSTSTEAGTQYDYLLKTNEAVNFAAYITTPTGISSVVKSSSTLVYSSN
jgi:hypothetical protein